MAKSNKGESLFVRTNRMQVIQNAKHAMLLESIALDKKKVEMKNIRKRIKSYRKKIKRLEGLL